LIYSLISGALVIAFLKIQYLIQPNIATVEMIFVSSLSSFIFNYTMLRKGGILPYVKDDSENMKAKFIGLVFILTVVSFMYTI